MRRVTTFFAAGLMLLAAVTLPTIRAAAQSEVVTRANLDETIVNAKTPADHEAIAAFYEQEAADTQKKGIMFVLTPT
jgi:hypothetical protein